MSITSKNLIGGGFFFPDVHIGRLTAFITNALVLDAASESGAMIFQAPQTGTISSVAFRTGTVTTGATMDVRLETVSTSTGDPTGTLWGTNTNGSQVIADTDDNTWFTTALTAGASVTEGDILALVIVNPAVSFGNLQIALMNTVSEAFPYQDLYTGSWAKDDEGNILALQYSDGIYYPVIATYPFSAISSVTWNNTSTPNEQGLYFKLPFPVNLKGVWLRIDLDGDANIVVYDSDGVTVLRTLAIYAAQRPVTSSAVHYYYFQSIPLNANTWYRIVVQPSSATNVSLVHYTAPSAAVMNAMPGGTNFYFTSAKNPTGEASWTQITTQVPNMGLICDGFQDGQTFRYF